MKNNFILILLALLSMGLLYFVKSQDKKPLSLVQTEKIPQEYMTHFLVTAFTEEGILKNKLSAQYWGYQPETKGSTLKNPHLILYKPDGSLWTIDAERGFIEQPNIGTLEKIKLKKHVVINRPAKGTIVPLRLETEELLYEPSKQYAESQQFVTMTKPGLKISGVGMRAFLEQGSVELLHDVKSYYTLNH